MRGLVRFAVPAVACAVASLLLSLHAAEASPWGRSGGDFFLSTRASYLRADAPTPAPDATGPVRLRKTETDLYGEAGLGDGFTAGGKVVYGSFDYFDGYEATASSGFTEAEAFLQKTVLETPSQALAVRIAGGAETRRRFAGRPEAGGGGVAEIGALYGRTLASAPVNVFVTAEAAYRHRFESSGDQIRGDAMLGVGRGRLLLLVGARTTTSIGAARAGSPDYDVVKLESSVVWRVARRMSLQAGFLHEAAGAGVLRGDQIFAGFWTRF